MKVIELKKRIIRFVLGGAGILAGGVLLLLMAQEFKAEIPEGSILMITVVLSNFCGLIAILFGAASVLFGAVAFLASRKAETAE